MLRYTQYVDLTDVADSLLIESGTVIAELQLVNESCSRCSIETKGEIRILWKDEIYTTPFSYPDDLIESIKSGDVYTDSNCYVDLNNWFEIFYEVNGKEDSDVLDVEFHKPQEIISIMLDYIT